MAPTLLDRVFPAQKASLKAVTGPGFVASSVYQPIYSTDNRASNRDPRRVMREAQSAYHMHPWIRACENLIGQRFSTVTWHLEDEEDNEIDDESPPQWKAIWNLIERPYTPKPGDPITNTPRTRSQLWKITSRHMGLCNVSAWFLNMVDATAGTPLEILYLNPARLTPGRNNIEQLTHWVLDADDQGNGQRLELNEVLLFQLDPPDSGWFGTGLVEAASQKMELSRLADRHTNMILAAGGRQGGVISPKDGQLNDDQYDQLVRDIRVMNEGPDAAKRWLVLKGPVDYTRTASTPVELNLLEIAQMAKEDILAMWGVPGSQLGIASPAGLNSGSAKDVDFEVLWQNAVGPRLRSFRETVQFELLDRWKNLGMNPEIVVEEPQFDDDYPRYELAAQAEKQPLRNSERRKIMGLDPFGDPALDNAIWMPTGVMSLGQAPDENGVITPDAPVLEQIHPPMASISDPSEKASVLPALAAIRDKIEAAMRADLIDTLAKMQRDVARRMEEHGEHVIKKPSDLSVLFPKDYWDRELEKVMRPHVRAIALASDKRITASMGKASLRDIMPRLLEKVGLRIKGINDYTRERISALVREGIDQGMSPAQLAVTLRSAPAFDELRAETIARTETGTLLNLAATESYRDLGVEKVLVYDSERDDICSVAHGQEWTLEEAEANPLGHPNCVRSFAPIVGAA